jgi:hypothetical protein
MPVGAKCQHSLDEMVTSYKKAVEENGHRWPVQAFCAVAALDRPQFGQFRTALLFDSGNGTEDEKISTKLVVQKVRKIRYP